MKKTMQEVVGNTAESIVEIFGMNASDLPVEQLDELKGALLAFGNNEFNRGSDSAIKQMEQAKLG